MYLQVRARVALMPTSQSASALENGSADCALLAGPLAYNVEKKGMHVVTTGEGLVSGLTVTAVSGKFYKEHKDLVDTFLAVQKETLDFMKKNPDKALELTAKATELKPEAVKEMAPLYDFSMTITPEAIAEVRKELGLDQPFLVRYVAWLMNCLQGDFGVSYTNPARTVLGELSRCLPATLSLAAMSLVYVIVLSLPIGFLSAVYKDSWFDRIMRGVVFATTAMPVYWVGLLLIWIVSIKIGFAADFRFRQLRASDSSGIYRRALLHLNLHPSHPQQHAREHA